MHHGSGLVCASIFSSSLSYQRMCACVSLAIHRSHVVCIYVWVLFIPNGFYRCIHRTLCRSPPTLCHSSHRHVSRHLCRLILSHTGEHRRHIASCPFVVCYDVRSYGPHRIHVFHVKAACANPQQHFSYLYTDYDNRRKLNPSTLCSSGCDLASEQVSLRDIVRGRFGLTSVPAGVVGHQAGV